jgi:pepsin A
VQDFWFANFDIGNSQNVSILIDTGSPDLLLNPGFYEPTNNSVSTGRNFTISFLTTNPDGSGSETV